MESTKAEQMIAFDMLPRPIRRRLTRCAYPLDTRAILVMYQEGCPADILLKRIDLTEEALRTAERIDKSKWQPKVVSEAASSELR